jgi:hypothetical protein
MTTPLTYGTVTYTGRRVIGDAVQPTVGRVIFHSLSPLRKVTGAPGTLTVHVADFAATLDASGVLQDYDTNSGVHLAAGQWQVTIDQSFLKPRLLTIDVPAGGSIDLSDTTPVVTPPSAFIVDNGDGTLSTSDSSVTDNGDGSISAAA